MSDEEYDWEDEDFIPASDEGLDASLFEYERNPRKAEPAKKDNLEGLVVPRDYGPAWSQNGDEGRIYHDSEVTTEPLDGAWRSFFMPALAIVGFMGFIGYIVFSLDTDDSEGNTTARGAEPVVQSTQNWSPEEAEFLAYIRGEVMENPNVLQSAKDQIESLPDEEVISVVNAFCEKEYTEREAKELFIVEDDHYTVNEIFAYGAWAYMCEPSPSDADTYTDDASREVFVTTLTASGVEGREPEEYVDTAVAACLWFEGSGSTLELPSAANPYEFTSLDELYKVWDAGVRTFCPEYVELF